MLRGLFILVGAVALDTFHVATYVLGALLAFTAVKIARHGGEPIDPESTCRDARAAARRAGGDRRPRPRS